MSIQVLLVQVLVLFLEIGLGMVAAKAGVLTDSGSKVLSNLIMSITLPCTLLASTNVEAGAGTVSNMLLAAAILLGSYLVSAVVCLFAARLLKLSAGQKAVMIAVTVLPNSAFMGIPLLLALLGPNNGMLYAASGIIAYNLFFFTYVMHLFEPEAKLEIKNFITPTNITTLIMVIMLVAGLHLPGPVESFATAIGNCTTPLALMIIGVMLMHSDLRGLFRNKLLYLMTALRCIVFPLLLLFVLSLLKLDVTLSLAVCIMGACPSGSLGAVLARQREMEPEMAGQAVAQSTLFSIVSIPLLLTLAAMLFPA